VKRGKKKDEVIPTENNFRLKEIRKAQGLTQAELANVLQLKSASTVTMWENGSRRPPSTILPRLADLLHCTIDELFGRSEPGGMEEGGAHEKAANSS